MILWIKRNTFRTLLCCTKFRALNPNSSKSSLFFCKKGKKRGRKRSKRQKKQNIYRIIMALIVGDDFQHILRVLNTNVDGREKVCKREFVFIVRVACVCARKGMSLKFSSPAFTFFSPRFLPCERSKTRICVGMDDAVWRNLASKIVRVVRKVFPRANACFSSEWRVRVVCCGAEMVTKFPRHFEDHQTRTKKGPERPIFLAVSPRGFRSSSLFPSLYSLSPSFLPFSISTHTFAFLYLSYSSHVFR